MAQQILAFNSYLLENLAAPKIWNFLGFWSCCHAAASGFLEAVAPKKMMLLCGGRGGFTSQWVGCPLFEYLFEYFFGKLFITH
jgi:hypothetical protein